MVALNLFVVGALALFGTYSLTEAAGAPTRPPWAASTASKLVTRGSENAVSAEKPDFMSLSGGPSGYKRRLPDLSSDAPHPYRNQRAEFAPASPATPLEWHSARTPSELYGSSSPAYQQSDRYDSPPAYGQYEQTYGQYEQERPRPPIPQYGYGYDYGHDNADHDNDYERDYDDYSYGYGDRHMQHVKPQTFVPVVALRQVDVGVGKHFRLARPVAASGLGDFAF